MVKTLSAEEKPRPTLSRVMFLFSYSPDTGELRRRITRGNGAVGDIAGSKGKPGHIQIMIDGGVYGAHQIIWLMITGAWSTLEIDHKDLNPKNNRWNNLREASTSQNQANTPLSKFSTTMVKGVVFLKHLKRKPYRACIMVRGKSIFLGYFVTAEDAGAAYHNAAIVHFGEFARAS